ncbi:SDR family NAD(P)-dependent oxidoreductase [Leptospira sp. 2 VSF19]|uniref:SDR family NAD(P)-dependent oxidoreductase n=1 Tax=Leptospira soteropolitanensis TaxID=2950025 RepID=A0AAW5VJU2_9LEPT|nr:MULTISPECIES: SDR family NAD(P)-dependent oxidoreductase [Leptospira]MCW7487837.1 SDR family NAD(P)-dependent oxidoreductase [Leptospira meyeri]MCW7494574.1 SDR family NAD(P)-dependent oxidoreductase [Leptospira soteropolitanensis]MCW7502168.1 SDR family NAD(P)-dependent oxidoreductase [Leptospira soteropolitanensis]MCW7524402.1 SDR family NAD(P)-dependent oxidoreductase [Leptospira soteropolitanensis]MCW7528268.1 SDR family NAD(P)-dependent oxidoreductase [Leptospira soteropolitanensis]
MKTSKERIALVTGANRGIGKQVSIDLAKQGIYVLIGARNPGEATDTLAAVQAVGKGEILSLDVSKEQSISEALDTITGSFGKLDILVNNAGIFADPGSFFDTTSEDLHRTLLVNLYGPLRLIQTFLPMMIQNDFGRIVNVSSGMGQLSDMGGGYPAYRISKTAINALTSLSSVEAAGKNIKINSVCPGWVKTDMGGASATRPVEKGAETIVWAATLPDSGPTGKFFRDKKEIGW